MRANDNNGLECSQRSLRIVLRSQTGDRDLSDYQPVFCFVVEKTGQMLDFLVSTVLGGAVECISVVCHGTQQGA